MTINTDNRGSIVPVVIVTFLLLGSIFVYMMYINQRSQTLIFTSQDIAEFPTHPSAQPQHPANAPNTLRWQTTDQSVPEVISWYLDTLQNAGWYILEMPANPTSETQQSAIFAKDAIRLGLVVTQTTDGSIVTVNLDQLGYSMSDLNTEEGLVVEIIEDSGEEVPNIDEEEVFEDEF